MPTKIIDRLLIMKDEHNKVEMDGLTGQESINFSKSVDIKNINGRLARHLG